jgi:hypothetical protein
MIAQPKKNPWKLRQPRPLLPLKQHPPRLKPLRLDAETCRHHLLLILPH